MSAEIYWIKQVPRGQLAVMPRPRGGEWLADEIEDLNDGGANVIVSALTCQEISELNLEREAALCEASGIEFVSFPIEDRQVPHSRNDFLALILRLRQVLKENKSLIVHCRMGIGRSGLIAASVLMGLGLTPDEAFEAIEAARRKSVPDTPEQRGWVETMAEKLNEQ